MSGGRIVNVGDHAWLELDDEKRLVGVHYSSRKGDSPFRRWLLELPDLIDRAGELGMPITIPATAIAAADPDLEQARRRLLAELGVDVLGEP